MPALEFHIVSLLKVDIEGCWVFHNSMTARYELFLDEMVQGGGSILRYYKVGEH